MRAAQVATHEGEADATRPMLPPADAEPPEAAAARLFGGRPAKSGLPDRGRSVGLLCLPLGLRRGPEGNPAFVLGSVSRAGAWRIGRTRVRSTISTNSLLSPSRACHRHRGRKGGRTRLRASSPGPPVKRHPKLTPILPHPSMLPSPWCRADESGSSPESTGGTRAPRSDRKSPAQRRAGGPCGGDPRLQIP